MDFKGHFAHAGGRCHPLTVLDDHGRFAVCLSACADEVTTTVAEIARTVMPGAHAVLVPDGAGWHTSNDLGIPGNISLRRRPPHAPELDPAETICGTYAVTSSRLVATAATRLSSLPAAKPGTG